MPIISDMFENCLKATVVFPKNIKQIFIYGRASIYKGDPYKISYKTGEILNYKDVLTGKHIYENCNDDPKIILAGRAIGSIILLGVTAPVSAIGLTGVFVSGLIILPAIFVQNTE
jgi:hypothetical protein